MEQIKKDKEVGIVKLREAVNKTSMVSHFGQGNPNSPIWFVGLDANFPKRHLLDKDNLLLEYLIDLEKGNYHRSMPDRYRPHPLLLLDGQKDGTKFWKNFLGIDKIHSDGVLQVTFARNRTDIVYNLWIDCRMFVTELAPRPSFNGKDIFGSYVKHDVPSLIREIDMYLPRIVVCLGTPRTMKRFAEKLRKSSDCQVIQAYHPSSSDWYKGSSKVVGEDDLERLLASVTQQSGMKNLSLT